jgi:RNA polymerase sigma factor (sigma-70 family)
MTTWATVYREHRAKVCSILRRRMPSRLRGSCDAEDFLHDGIVSLLQAGTMPHDAAQRLLIVAARRRQIDATRRACGAPGRYRDPGFTIQDLRDVDGARPTPPEELEARECLERLLSRCRDDEEWRLVNLKRLGYSTPEAAAELGMCERRAQRILQRLSRAHNP